MAEAKQSEVMRQIQEAFRSAHHQLSQLRDAVTHTADLARINSRANYLQMEKDRVLRELGEAIWRLVQKGKLELPPSLTSALQAVEEAEKKAEAHAREITDILQEGEEVAARLKGKSDPKSQTMLASKTKKK